MSKLNEHVVPLGEYVWLNRDEWMAVVKEHLTQHYPGVSVRYESSPYNEPDLVFYGYVNQQTLEDAQSNSMSLASGAGGFESEEYITAYAVQLYITEREDEAMKIVKDYGFEDEWPWLRDNIDPSEVL